MRRCAPSLDSPKSNPGGNAFIWVREAQVGGPYILDLFTQHPGAYGTTTTVTWKPGQKYKMTLNLLPRPGTGINTVTRTAIDLSGFAPPSQ